MRPQIPTAGLISPDAIRVAEATSTEFSQVMELVRLALAAKLGVEKWAVYPVAIYPDRVVAMRDGRHYAYPYTIGTDNVVTIGDATEVVQQFDPVRVAEASAFVEARDDEGVTWDVTLIRAGVSHNQNYYSDAVLRDSVRLFEGARVYARSDEEHVGRIAKDVNQIVGWVDGVRFVEGVATDTGSLAGVLHFVEGSKVRATLVDAWKRGKRDLMGLSIDAKAKTAPKRVGKDVFREAVQFSKINSVDVIVEPSAGGAFVRLIEATQESDPMRERLIAKIKQAPKTAAKIADIAALTDDELEQRYTEAVAELATPQRADRQDGPVDTPVTAEQLRMVEARFAARNTIAACNLPQPAKDRLQASFDARERFVEADVAAAIEGERAYLGRFVESGHVALPDFGNGARAEDRSKKIGEMLDAYFSGTGGVTSIKECYIEITGDRHVTGLLANCDRSRMAEAAGATGRFAESVDTSTFANVLGSSIARRMIEEYRQAIEYDSWRNIVRVVPVSDFRSQELTRMGGYGNLPAVNQGAPYTALTSPSDEKATYALTKRGGTEDITIETIANDDARLVRQIPTSLGRAARRTLHEFAFDFIRTNPTLYDSVAWFHATHANLGSSALDATSWAAARLAMVKQTEANSGKRLGIPPKILVVPADLEETAYNMFARTTNNDPNYVQSMGPTTKVIVVPYWTDTTDWAAMADPRDIPSIEIGFYNGQEEPELFIQDSPTVGSLFSHDKLTWKIRHIYGGQVHNYRGGYKAVVAG